MSQLLFDRIRNTPERSPAPLLLVRGVAQRQLRGMTVSPE